MNSAMLRRWRWVHKWSSLVSMIFLLLICITGVPLVFADEIDHGLHPDASYEHLTDTPNVSLDRLLESCRTKFPGQIITSVLVDEGKAKVVVWLAPSWKIYAEDRRLTHSLEFDARTGDVLEPSQAASQRRRSFINLMMSLHTDLFLGLPGQVFMALMASLFITAIVSGVALYHPFMRKLNFGVVRVERSRPIQWLDLHNLLGAVTVAWALVVGATGVTNELSTPLMALWRRTYVQALLVPWARSRIPAQSEFASLQTVLNTAAHALPDMTVTRILFPGSINGSPYHYLLWAHGKTRLTSRLFTPVLVDARTGEIATPIKVPCYLRLIELSRPLHSGDYAGLPLKVIWVLLDVVTIAVLCSGFYLWAFRRKSSTQIKS